MMGPGPFDQFDDNYDDETRMASWWVLLLSVLLIPVIRFNAWFLRVLRSRRGK